MKRTLTTDDVAVVVFVLVPDIQQQVGAVRIWCAKWGRAGHQLTGHLLTNFIQVQLPYTTDDTVNKQRLLLSM